MDVRPRVRPSQPVTALLPVHHESSGTVQATPPLHPVPFQAHVIEWDVDEVDAG